MIKSAPFFLLSISHKLRTQTSHRLDFARLLDKNTGYIKMIGAVLKLIIFTSMVKRIISTSRNERVTQQVRDTYRQMFDVCTLRHTAHIEAIVQFLPYSAPCRPCPWPARSPDLTPCDYFLWGYVKDKVFVPPQPVSIPDLKN